MNKPKLWKDYKLVDDGNLTKNLHTLHYFHNQLISEYDNGNVENILIENNQLKQKVNQLETNWNELKDWLEYHKVRPTALSTIYAQMEYNFYEGVLNKIKELERGKE